MGALCSRDQQAIDGGETKDEEITRKIKQQSRDEKNVEKLLLLGAGESGKSTIFKQIKILFETNFLGWELDDYTTVIHANLYQACKVLYDGCVELAEHGDSEKYKMEPETKALGKKISDICDASEYPMLSKELAEQLDKLWRDPAIQATYVRANELQLPDCTEYFLKHVYRLAEPSYKPTQEDVLYARVRTTGVAEIEFSPDKQRRYRLYDVGGQRSERKKWIHLFDGVKAIIFCAALSEYDQNLFEDERKNRMVETKELFIQVLREPAFKHTSFLLFLNKYDIFEKKAATVPLSQCEWFNDYQPSQLGGRFEVDHAYEYIKRKFEDIYKEETPMLGLKRLFKVYKTTALDKNLIKETFELVNRSLQIELLLN